MSMHPHMSQIFRIDRKIGALDDPADVDELDYISQELVEIQEGIDANDALTLTARKLVEDSVKNLQDYLAFHYPTPTHAT